ncbi:hypothetical protein MHBO_001275 [Bonamia ostreae]|uniref:HTH cro/C1-type domain-containing protein n=1 Tax=Bonamia ostreae TaxID=126728 RepID=A0ABV2AIE0_9EUKA
MSGITQDWNVVKLRKSKQPKKATLKEAERKNQVYQVKKANAGGQRKLENTNMKALKDEEDINNFKHNTISHSFKVALQKARMQNKMSQTELAQKANLKPAIVNSYESGKAIPNPQIIAKFERILKVKLPRNKKANN